MVLKRSSMYFLKTIWLQTLDLCNLPQSWWPFLLMPLPLLPSRTIQVNVKSFAYNDSSFGLSFKSYITLVSVALAQVFNGLQQSCTSYQWQYGLFGSFIMRVFACRHQLGSCCLASCINASCIFPPPSCPHCSLLSELCCSLTLNFSPWHLTFLYEHRIFKRVTTR